ncbi:glutamate-cysteine ligase family protein [Nocardioides sp. AX2bis]|uniref:glutamate-cysteine ligase family protein n=1 Tax=Nocardioides sp. AX2bis TaxID=2653157 RepID=UPI0012EF9D5C|nr:glutamate-cysteine ligase family protein [Nocardioides sp. AX2bis]VXB24682.1 Glutamate--cysteine ligase EgtA [Nocardioides sp. AX2bis]
MSATSSPSSPSVARGATPAPVPLPHLREVLAAAGPPPRGSRLTFEPGGQVELSSLPHQGASACWSALEEDARHVRTALEAARLRLLDTALDPYRVPRRQLQHPRYDAMEQHFVRAGGASASMGPAMMTTTAACQVNLDVGRDRADAHRRWALLHAVGPVMVAAFANSPVDADGDTGWRSGRQRVWQGLERGRTSAPQDGDPVAAWTDYALDASVMLRRGKDDDWAGPAGWTLRDWLLADDPLAETDLALHLTTLFPPVRPRGWYEVRYLDTQPYRWWVVPTAVLAALLDDPVASAAAEEACAGLDDWTAAARDGLAAPGLQAAAVACLDAALAALTRLGEDPALVALVAAFRDTYTASGRCPADDPLETA